MTKTAKTILTVTAIVLPLGLIILLITWAMNIWNKINFKPYFVSADLQGLSLKDIPAILLSGERREIKVVMGMEVTNDSDTSISFSGLRASLSYEGNLLGRTSDALANQKFVAEANNSSKPLQVTDTITLILDQTVAKLLLDKFVLNQKPQIDYEIEITILGIPILRWFPIKNNFTW